MVIQNYGLINIVSFHIMHASTYFTSITCNIYYHLLGEQGTSNNYWVLSKAIPVCLSKYQYDDELLNKDGT
jgi:hypothetical protein